MKIRIGQLRRLIAEGLNDTPTDEDRRAIRRLTELAESKRPHLRGQWKSVPRPRGDTFGVRIPDCWSAEDPILGTIYLNVYSDRMTKTIGRLRDPSGTRYVLTACYSMRSHRGAMWDCPTILKTTWAGEDRSREQEKFTSFRTRIYKMFGIDTFSWKGDIFSKPAEAEKPKAADPAVDDSVPTADTTTASTTSTSGEKLYKLYGKGPAGKRDASKLHTGHKGKFYLSPDDTKFKSNDRARLSLSSDGRLKVINPESEHSQDWDPSER